VLACRKLSTSDVSHPDDLPHSQVHSFVFMSGVFNMSGISILFFIMFGVFINVLGLGSYFWWTSSGLSVRGVNISGIFLLCYSKCFMHEQSSVSYCYYSVETWILLGLDWGPSLNPSVQYCRGVSTLNVMPRGGSIYTIVYIHYVYVYLIVYMYLYIIVYIHLVFVGLFLLTAKRFMLFK